MYVLPWIGGGAMPTAWGLDGSVWCQFGSAHPRVVQFCYADGAVQAVPKTIDSGVLRALSGIADGELACPDF